MSELGFAGRLVARDDRRLKDRRKFSYTAFVPDRRVRPDRRNRIPLYLVELEEEELSSLLESPDER